MKTSDTRSGKSAHTASQYLASKLAHGAKPSGAQGSKATSAEQGNDSRERAAATRPAASGGAGDAVLRSMRSPQQRPSPAPSHNNPSAAPRTGAPKPKSPASVGTTAALLFKDTAQYMQKAALVAAARKKQLVSQAPPQGQAPTTLQPRPQGQAPATSQPRTAAAAAQRAKAAPAAQPQQGRVEVRAEAAADGGHDVAKPQPPAPAPAPAPQALPSHRRNQGCSVIAHDLSEGRLTPIEAVRIAGDFRDLDTYAEVSRLAVGLLPVGTFQQRSVLWNLYLAYAGCGKRSKAAEVLDALFAMDKLVLEQPLTRVLAHYDLGYMERVEAPKRPEDAPPQSLGDIIGGTKANLLAWCDVRGLLRASTGLDVDHAAFLSDLHGAPSTEASEAFEDAAEGSEPPEGSEPAAADEDALATLLRQLDVAVEAQEGSTPSAEGAEPQDDASEKGSEPAYEDADRLQMFLDGFAFA